MTASDARVVSEGTLQPRDLIPRFREELHELAADDVQPHERELLNLACTMDPEREYASVLVNDLIDALGERAPDGLYFGTAEGDGACFGFFPTGDDDA